MATITELQKKEYLITAIANEFYGLQVYNRIYTSQPSDQEAKTQLQLIKNDAETKAMIREYLVVALADRSAGEELAAYLDLLNQGLQAIADSDSVSLAEVQAQIVENPLSETTQEIFKVAIPNEEIAEALSGDIEVSGQVLENTSLGPAPAVATALVITQQPTNADVDTIISPAITVEIRDQFGALFSSTAPVAVAILSGTGVLTGTTAVNAVGGVATFSDLEIDAADSFTLQFTSAGLTSANSASFDMIAPITGLTWNTTGSAGVFTTTPTSIRVENDGASYAFIQANEEVVSGDIVFEFKADPLAPSQRIVGLDISPYVTTNGGYGLIDFAINLNGNSYDVWEAGASYGSGTFVSGDSFKITVVSGVVKYYHNNNLFYTSLNTLSTYPVKLSGAMFGYPTDMYDITFDELAAAGLTWADSGSGTYASTSNSVTKTSGSEWNLNIKSVETIASGDGYVQATGVGGVFKIIGLQNQVLHPTGSYENVDFGINIDSTGVYKIESGTNTLLIGGTPTLGYTYKVAIEGVDIVYYQDTGSGDVEIGRTVAPTINYPMSAASVLYATGAGFEDIHLV